MKQTFYCDSLIQSEHGIMTAGLVQVPSIDSPAGTPKFEITIKGESDNFPVVKTGHYIISID